MTVIVRRRALCFAAAFAMLASTSGAASAQAWIGAMVGEMVVAQNEARCMSGVPLSPEQVAAARAPASALMQDYWTRVAAANSTDVSALFHDRGRAEWVAPGTTRERDALIAVADPFARRAGAALAAEPLVFVRALSGSRARGVWRVEPVGSAEPTDHYLVDFRRRGGTWKVSRIELFPAGSAVPELTEYCREPGDIERARAEEIMRQARRAARRAEAAAAAAERR
jgi:hypothetical protein